VSSLVVRDAFSVYGIRHALLGLIRRLLV